MSNTSENQIPVKSESALTQVNVARNGIQLQTMDDVFRFSKAVVAAGLAPKGLEKAEAVFVAIQMGLEVGISPMAAIQNIAVVNGKPKFYGSMPLALVRASGLLEDIEERIDGTGDDRVAVCTTKRRGSSVPRKTTFSVKDAKTAGLWGTNVWAKYPERMLAYRARGFNLDDNFSDVLKGMASHEGVIELDASAVTVTKEEKPVKVPLEAKPVEANEFRSERSYQKLRDGFLKGEWQKAESHIGTGEMPIKGLSLKEVQELNPKIWDKLLEWQPKLTEGKFNLNDLALRAALDAAQLETSVEVTK
jgi:hypothetical protein